MPQMIHTLALAASLVALVASLWQDWGTVTTLKRMLVSYLAFYSLGAVMAVAVRLAASPEYDQREAGPPPAPDKDRT